MKNARIAIAAMIVVAACSDPNARTGEHHVRAYDAVNNGKAEDCSCFWASYGYASSSACVNDRTTTPLGSAVEACIVAAGRDYPELEARLECVADAEEARTACYYSAPSCSASTFDACDDAADAQLAYCETLRCADFSSTSSCSTAYANYTAETNACF